MTPNKRLPALRIYLSFFLFFCFATHERAQAQDIAKMISEKDFDCTTLLWYTKNAAKWEDALPVGNGRLGAMVYGNTGEEVIQLNEDTYWTGGPYSTVVKNGYRSLPEIQDLVFKGEYEKAQKLFGRTIMGYPVEQQKYQSLGSLHLFLADTTAITDYKRWLDLGTGISGVEYKSNGVMFRREVFASAPDQAIVIRFTTGTPGALSFTANLRGQRNQAHSNYATDYFRMDGDGPSGLKLTGKSADYLGVAGKLKFDVRLRAEHDGGDVSVDGDNLNVQNATSVTVYIAAATNFVNFHDVSADETARVVACLKAIAGKRYDDVRSGHVKDYQSLFNRVSLKLPVIGSSWLPTDERLMHAQDEADPSLAALAYQFGRYILISSSRPGTQAANLQGIWNNDMNPAWDSKYTTNINLQMNYWAVETANLSECAEPLVQLLKDVMVDGEKVAREHYGASGWVLHQNTDIWRVAAPMDGPTWGTFTTAGAWLTDHLWEHFLFTGDTDFLKDVYPVIKGSAQFFLDFLVEDPQTKYLVTNPSSSPENFPARPGNKRFFDETTGSFIPGTNICAGSSIDMQIIMDLFDNCIRAGAILGGDAGFSNKVKAARKRLLPPQIARDGALQEWAQDWGQTEKEHRHVSPLYGLFPGNVMSLKKTPALIDACKTLLERRGYESTGWSRAWKTNLWARLHDGEKAVRVLNGYLAKQTYPQLFARAGGPMQVDATLGMTSAVSEMLMQSNDGFIQFLPALPGAWKNGQFTGVCARNAFVVNMKWENNKMASAEILSKKGLPCAVEAANVAAVFHGGKKVAARWQEGSLIFATEKGGSYTIQFKK